VRRATRSPLRPKASESSAQGERAGSWLCGGFWRGARERCSPEATWGDGVRGAVEEDGREGPRRGDGKVRARL